jgi:opacity protein-like surface antigen
VGVGAVFHQLEIGGSDAGIDEDVGFEVGGGLAFSVAPGVRVTPGIGYRRYATSISGLGGLVRSELDVEYFTAGVGLNISF